MHKWGGSPRTVMYIEVRPTFSVVSARSHRPPHSGSAIATEPSWGSNHHRVGELVQMHRLNQRLSISALAERVNLSAQALARIERGEETPTLDILERIRRTLQVPA